MDISTGVNTIIKGNQLISPLCRIYASVDLVIIGSGNGLSPVLQQAITWTKVGLWSTGLLGINFSDIFVQEKWFGYIVCQNGGYFVQVKMS